MNTIDLIDGPLYQWDTGRKIELRDTEINEVHFSTKNSQNALVMLPHSDNGVTVADIPNILLQDGNSINVYAVVYHENGERTIYDRTFGIHTRAKPDDYIYYETEVLTYKLLEDRIKSLENNSMNTPVQSVNGKTGAVQLTAHDVGALAQDDLQAGVDAALAQAKASGEFDGTDGEDGGYYTPSVDAGGNLLWAASKADMPAAAGANIKGAPGANGKSAYQYAVEGGYTGTEEEFAAKLAQEIPNALPNPNALTFTGAVTGSYDGSAPLRVEIPSGGGAGGEAWKLLSDETVTEDVTEYKRIFESVYRIAVLFYTPGGTNGAVNIRINNAPHSYVHSATINKKFPAVSMLYMIRPPKTVMAEHPTSNGALLITAIPQTSSGCSATNCDRNITSLVLSDGTVYTGTRIVIYGEEW